MYTQIVADLALALGPALIIINCRQKEKLMLAMLAMLATQRCVRLMMETLVHLNVSFGAIMLDPMLARLAQARCRGMIAHRGQSMPRQL